ncbi:hypothetical protein BDV37DRAFT_264446 [Aspergillus pseudonomiae]|uniref:Uncharacterized protein n=1 Tax=Aspergillus pseudonomiae TaxID=1506151 RepID=A0A5N7CWP1_9EURO|nr:uncharacterized protein BDV37DRAFT_264446 [Aspergillus pseudonomiae]KAE8397988.1 hypothetical protein BDV37DRAFT_264446 [Aspergillus pseudonomiae]
MAVQRSTHCECTPTVSSFVEESKSAVQNTHLGRATESEGKVASDGEHIHGRSDCNDGMAFPSAKQNSNWAPETGPLFDCPGSMPLQPPGSQVDSVTSFLCLRMEWHSYSELRWRAPQLLTHYVHHTSFQHSPRVRKDGPFRN